jgi:hypothetical protein
MSVPSRSRKTTGRGDWGFEIGDFGFVSTGEAGGKMRATLFKSKIENPKSKISPYQ